MGFWLHCLLTMAFGKVPSFLSSPFLICEMGTGVVPAPRDAVRSKRINTPNAPRKQSGIWQLEASVKFYDYYGLFSSGTPSKVPLLG